MSDKLSGIGEGLDAGTDTYTTLRDFGAPHGLALTAAVIVGFIAFGNSSQNEAPPTRESTSVTSTQIPETQKPPLNEPNSLSRPRAPETGRGVRCEDVIREAQANAGRTRSDWRWWLSEADKAECLGETAPRSMPSDSRVPKCVKFNGRLICE